MIPSFLCKNKISRAALVWMLSFTLIGMSHYESLAGCNCGSDYYETIAYEYTAQSCPPLEANDNTVYYYKSDQITCRNNNLTYYSANSDGDFTPQQIINTYKNILRVLRNPSGTHIIAVFTYYTGSILGINIPSSPGVYTYPELDKYCLNIGVPDTDYDGFPDCLDPCPEDEINQCQVCDQNREELIAQCHGEENILYWDPVNCTGRCMQGANLGDCSDQ
ncbi:MAG: hypothetical protein ACOY3O_13965 [Thermodesulfobacteriota bacterium]